MIISQRFRSLVAHPIISNLIKLALAFFLLLYVAYFFKLIDIPAFSRDDAAIEELSFFDEPIPLGDAPAFIGAAQTSLDRSPQNFRLGVFWASWCGVCKTAIPKIIGMAPELQRQGIGLAFVSTSDSRAGAAGEVRERAQTGADPEKIMPVTLEDNAGLLFGRLNLRLVPRFVLINHNAEAVGYARLNFNSPELPEALGALARLNNK